MQLCHEIHEHNLFTCPLAAQNRKGSEPSLVLESEACDEVSENRSLPAADRTKQKHRTLM